jgi:hypothetical protein
MILWPRRTKYTSRSQMILIETFSPSTGEGLSKTAQFEIGSINSLHGTGDGLANSAKDSNPD